MQKEVQVVLGIPTTIMRIFFIDFRRKIIDSFFKLSILDDYNFGIKNHHIETIDFVGVVEGMILDNFTAINQKKLVILVFGLVVSPNQN